MIGSRVTFFGGPYSLVLFAHMSVLCFLQLGKYFVDILDVDKGPCEVVSLSDAFEPCFRFGETGGALEISNCWFDAGELV